MRKGVAIGAERIDAEDKPVWPPGVVVRPKAVDRRQGIARAR